MTAKQDRSELFRRRLSEAMALRGMSRAELARRISVDRSTLTQLLQAEAVRMPNAHIAAEIAASLGVSADWLLGLSHRPESATDLVASAMTLTEAPRALVDERIFAWHREAAGYKIRHVPATLPDMLKTDDVLMWEYEPSLGRTIEQAVGASRDRLNWMRGSQSDYEIALPLHELSSFAKGEGYYAGLSPGLRRAQIDHLLELDAQLYPRLRIFLFDARKLYSAPVTIFGPLLAVLYLGRNYLAFRDTEQVQSITRHFDMLVRKAEVPDRGLADVLRSLRRDAGLG